MTETGQGERGGEGQDPEKIMTIRLGALARALEAAIDKNLGIDATQASAALGKTPFFWTRLVIIVVRGLSGTYDERLNDANFPHSALLLHSSSCCFSQREMSSASPVHSSVASCLSASERVACMCICAAESAFKEEGSLLDTAVGKETSMKLKEKTEELAKKVTVKAIEKTTPSKSGPRKVCACACCVRVRMCEFECKASGRFDKSTP